jgi:hypothetical protein
MAPHNAVSGAERRAQIGRAFDTIAPLSMPRSDIGGSNRARENDSALYRRRDRRRPRPSGRGGSCRRSNATPSPSRKGSGRRPRPRSANTDKVGQRRVVAHDGGFGTAAGGVALAALTTTRATVRAHLAAVKDPGEQGEQGEAMAIRKNESISKRVVRG